MASNILNRISSPCRQKFSTRIWQGLRHDHKSASKRTFQSRVSSYENRKTLLPQSQMQIRNGDDNCLLGLQLRSFSTISCSFKMIVLTEFSKSDCCREPRRQYSIELDSTDVRGRSLDKKIYFLIEKWYLEEAVDLVKRSVLLGVLPSGNTMVSLLKHLTDVGDVENSIELTNILLEHHLVLKKNIFPHLTKVFYNSGLIEEGIKFMELNYNATKKFQDIETLFALVASLTFREFADKSYMIEKFVDECAEEDKYRAMAHLWKCYMLAEQFEKADNILETNKEELKSLLPMVINEICQMKDRVEVDREVVMSRLCDMENLSKKQRAYAYETLLSILDSKQSWKQLLDILMKARGLALPLPRIQVDRYIKNLEYAEEREVDIEELRKWSQIL
ncbi:uncharacterized protein LOC135495562 [Lineus longissimus]|uniref:uncharacterized protein LOC135495562 n=1 Tax=Lineus longissimus TaxID=88925 RepID=UPI002B4D2FAE